MANKFKETQFRAELLERLYNKIEEEIHDITHTYEITGKKNTQRKDWRTGELMWEDEEKTIPIMEDQWEYVSKETLSEDDDIRLAVCDEIKALLEKML